MISVIIPVFNVVDYLEKSVESILKQTYQDFEVILVDDGSSDGSELLCDKLAIEDSRIKVIHKENGGVSSARNQGLVNAGGDYLFFLDADDYIDESCFSLMLDIAEKYDVDVVKSNIYHEYADGTKTDKVETGEFGLISLKDKSVDFSNKFNFAAVWGKLYKRRVLETENGIQLFDEKIHYAEDYLYVIQVVIRGQTMYSMKEELYHSVTRDGSAVNSPFGLKKFSQIFALEKIEHLTRGYPIANKKIAIMAAEYAYYCYYQVIANSIDLGDENINEIRRILKKNVRNITSANSVGKKQKIMYWIAIIMPSIFEKYVKKKRMQ